ncbi:MAG: DNA repair protein RecN [Lentisphaeraceae bacterium]|nr:DNA repair protein RecN [Lentisphaeraceae bacterium]
MLTSLHIKNLALVEQLDIDFSAGLNTVTGETGAGKSVILGAIKLLLGERADKSLIRTDASKAEISAIIELGSIPFLKNLAEKILENAGIEADESGQIILRRVISPSSSKNFINSTPTSLATMKDLGKCFIDIYAPGEQQGLADNSKQRFLLDRYGNLGKNLETVKAAYEKLRVLEEEKENFHNEVPDRGELEILRYQFKEIKDANLQKNEDETVNLEYNQSAGAKELMESSLKAQDLISGDDNSIINSIQFLTRQLQEMASIDETNAGPFLDTAETLSEGLNDLSRDLDSYTNRLNLDPENLAFLEERMSIIQQMKRKYGPELSDVFTYAAKLNEKISKADKFEDLYDELLANIETAQKDFNKAAATLSKKRHGVTKGLASSISEQLKDLGFKSSEFTIEISQTKESSTGFDHIEFCFAPNAGEGTKPIKDIGSSGEISRVMLAVKSVLAKIDQVPVLIFDEIDANIGGIVATQVAKKLVSLGKEHQIFCITHMPQVAAGGCTHYRVEKNVKNGRTFTEMVLLENEDRVEEVARMLGGTDISSVVRSHASELLASTI